jgi:hypothetical protein
MGFCESDAKDQSLFMGIALQIKRSQTHILLAAALAALGCLRAIGGGKQN